ncbi:hypothetical protein [Paenarthrobacter sp. NPDC018779]|uniref:hypothetical protein n=1 Tax=Paenarthrobacter sp. NPDC018779 TaxID=3364375 RepID=UPI0037C79C07
MRAGSATQLPRITVEVPVLDVGAPLESLGRYVDSVRKPEGLHMTLLHVGILDRLAADVVAWTGGVASADTVIREVASWLRGLPVLDGFLGKSAKLITLGGGRVSSLEVSVPQAVHDYQTLLVQGLHVLLDDLGVDNIDDFILSSPALGYRSPRWIPHVAVGRARSKHEAPLELETVALEFGSSRIRNEASLPSVV